MFSKLILLIFSLSAELLSQNINAIQIRIIQTERELAEKKQELVNEQEKNPSYFIGGEIRDIDEYYIMIWGSAAPTNNDYSLKGTVIKDFIHLFVKPNKSNIFLNSYRGTHYYLYRDKSGNKVFGDLPIKDQENIASIQKRINELENELISLTNNLKLAQTNSLIDRAKEKLSSADYDESIILLLEAKKTTTTNKEIDQLLLNNYVGLAKKDSSNKNYTSALSRINTAIQLINLSEQSANGLKRFHSEICLIIADEKYNDKIFSEAVEYYSQSIYYDEINLDLIKERYADSYFNLGNYALSNGNIEKAKYNYLNSFRINNSRLSEIKARLESQQKSSFLLGISSIIPGLGQWLQGDSKTAKIHFGIFSASLIGGYVYQNISTKEYRDYKKATIEHDAVNLYASANDKLNISYAFYGFGGAFMIYSIIDSYLKVDNFNRSCEINFGSYSQSSLLNNDNVTISMKVFF